VYLSTKVRNYAPKSRCQFLSVPLAALNLLLTQTHRKYLMLTDQIINIQWWLLAHLYRVLVKSDSYQEPVWAGRNWHRIQLNPSTSATLSEEHIRRGEITRSRSWTLEPKWVVLISSQLIDSICLILLHVHLGYWGNPINPPAHATCHPVQQLGIRAVRIRKTDQTRATSQAH